MDERQHAELRRWAMRLQESSANEELRAAGKAILLLTEEVAQLTLQLEAARAGVEEPDPASSLDSQSRAEPALEHEQGARSWLRRTFGLEPEEGASEER